MCLFIYVESIIFIGRLSVGWGINVTLYILGFSLKKTDRREHIANNRV